MSTNEDYTRCLSDFQSNNYFSTQSETWGKWLALPAYRGQSLLQWFSSSAAPFLTFAIVVRKLFL